MHRNMGSADRLARALIVAPVLLVLALIIGPSSVAGVALFVLAVVMLATSAAGFCPLYVPLRIDTHSRHGETA